MIINPSLPSGHTVFCDDIRHEINGKITLVGTYTNIMYISGSLPHVLPKFCLGIVFREAKDSLDNVTIKIFFPGDDENPIGVVNLVSQPDLNIPDLDEFSFKEFRLFFEATGVVIKQEGRIRVRAYKNDDEIRLGSLTVALADDTNLGLGEEDNGNSTEH